MPLSNFPNGFSQGVSIQGLPLLSAYSTSAGPTNVETSGVYWVDSTYGANGNPGTMYLPLATLAYAVTKVKANDIIILKQGFTESVSSATSHAISTAGVTVLGVGTGTNRPTITLDTAATSTITVSAANVAFKNIIFVANFADIATCFTITTAKGFVVDSCEFRDTSSILNFLALVTTNATANAADDFQFVGNRVFLAGTTAATTPIKAVGTNARWKINDNYFNEAVLNNTSAVLAQATTKVLTNLQMARNLVFRPNTDTATGGILVTTDATTNTGMIHDNYVQAADVAAAILVTAGCNYGMFNNLYDGDADASGFVLPAIGVN